MRIDRDQPTPTVIGGQEAAPSARRPVQQAVRVALLDDHAVVRDGLASWLSSRTDEFDVVLTASTWLELVHSPAFPTDLVVLDVQLSEPVSIESRVRTCRAAGAQVIVLTALDGDDVRERALRAGAAAFLSTTQSLLEILDSARTVMGLTGDGPVQRTWRPGPIDAVRRPRLSLGEESALRLYTSGLSTGEVAAEMLVRFETAKTYLRRVREKYARAGRPAGRRAELILRATEDGYL